MTTTQYLKMVEYQAKQKAWAVLKLKLNGKEKVK